MWLHLRIGVEEKMGFSNVGDSGEYLEKGPIWTMDATPRVISFMLPLAEPPR